MPSPMPTAKGAGPFSSRQFAYPLLRVHRTMIEPYRNYHERNMNFRIN